MMSFYAILFMLFAAVLIAGYFYLMRAKQRDDAKAAGSSERASVSDTPVRGSE